MATNSAQFLPKLEEIPISEPAIAFLMQELTPSENVPGIKAEPRVASPELAHDARYQSTTMGITVAMASLMAFFLPQRNGKSPLC